MAQIFELIGKAMAEVGAIGKDSRNATQGFMYRGIDAVYNALNPVMAKYGLFICPEVLDQKREERTTSKGNALIYTVLTMKYTIYAPDGSNVSCVVVGEGMDSGDKSANKAMSVAMKYAMFQLFFIPTEDLKDPDAECHEVEPKEFKRPETKANVSVETKPTNPVIDYIKNENAFMAQKLGLNKIEFNARFAECRKSLINSGAIQNIPAETMTMEQAKTLIKAVKEILIKDDSK